MLSNVLTELKCHPVKVRNLKPIQIRLWLIIERWIITHQRMKIKTYPNSSPFLVHSRIGIFSRMIGNIAYTHGHNAKLKNLEQNVLKASIVWRET